MGCDASFCSSLSRPLFQFTQPKRAATFKCKINFITIDVSIHAAQAGCDEKQKSVDTHILMFQFTQPKRAATLVVRRMITSQICFNSRSPSGLRPTIFRYGKEINKFLFTQPKRAATFSVLLFPLLPSVSIHAAQAGCDVLLRGNGYAYIGFNSRSPSGLRRPSDGNIRDFESFNSRSPSGLRLRFRVCRHQRQKFQFTQPKRAATAEIKEQKKNLMFQFTQPKRAATSTRRKKHTP